MKQTLTEIKVWGLTWGLAGLIAGGSLGALLSGGNYLAWITGGALLGTILAGLLGGAIALMLEALWLVFGKARHNHPTDISD